MAALPTQKIKISFKGKSPENPDTVVSQTITVPVSVTVDDTTAATNVSVLVNGEQKPIATIEGLDIVNNTFDGEIKLTEDGVDNLLAHLEENDNLANLDVLTDNNVQLKTFLETGITSPDDGLSQAKKEAKNVYNEGATSEAKEVVSAAGGSSFAEQTTEDLAPKSTTPEEAQTAEPVVGVIGVNPGSDDQTQAELTNQKVSEDALAGQTGAGALVDTNKAKSLGKDALFYPSTMDKLQQDYIKISTYRYTPQQIEGLTFKEITTKGDPERTIYLPTNATITDSNTVSWGSNSMNPIQIAMFNLARKSIKGDPGDAIQDLSGQIRKNLTNGDTFANIKDAATTKFAEEASGVTGMLSRTQGAIFNPNMALMFNNPEMRNFTFSWKMSARDGGEAEMIRKIIRTFKQTMAVRKDKANLFLIAPNVYRISYHTKSDSEEHKSIGKIKLCALTGCNVNYVPDGSYMTFNDEARTMTAYQLDLSFSEMEPVYYDDYTDSEDVIGY